MYNSTIWSKILIAAAPGFAITRGKRLFADSVYTLDRPSPNQERYEYVEDAVELVAGSRSGDKGEDRLPEAVGLDRNWEEEGMEMRLKDKLPAFVHWDANNDDSDEETTHPTLIPL
ncbi:hypothetical protein BDK51DRAFT_34694 [Blyttiomyces helicus]|uniref:Uncharacterized protein n=1 Tax=Blyttiomyces helicus TaxID=388810 RepID=A0A4P9WKE7_9FUNG|nr:hypothetical protein BDK51DRAFT_34694 [Blyttiomyces helicus]|eukprot:RKO93459.1 hypothetical protein BDK51DRAFT_34694 [Blyttiomyces helicus]